VIGETAGAEAGEDAEDQVEGAGEKFCREAHWTGGRDAELGDEPEGFGSEGGRGTEDESFQIGLGEAVEEEMGDDEVVFFGGGVGEGEGVGLVGVESGGGVGCGCLAAAAEEFEHGFAEVYRVGVEVGVCYEELGQKAAVSVAEDEGLPLVKEAGKIVDAAALEGWAEGEVFEPAVGTGYQVEVGFGTHLRKVRRRSGVRRARSAAARSVVAARVWRRWCRMRRATAAAAVAEKIGQGA
jgi:hypothetical protein